MVKTTWKNLLLVLAVLAAVLFAPLGAETAFAGADTPLVIDDQADLLSGSEEEKIRTEMEKLAKSSGWVVFVLTTNDTEGKSSQAYADDYMDAGPHAYEKDAVCFLIDMEHRKVTISTEGKAIKTITDQKVEDIIDAGYDDLKNGKYAACFEKMVAKTRKVYQNGHPHFSVSDFLIAFGVALAVFAVTGLTITGSYKMNFGNYSYDYQANSKLDLTVKQDTFVNEVVTHRHIQRSDSSGGDGGTSTTHKSAGGVTHGGGSRGF